jgi:hypothetical protein
MLVRLGYKRVDIEVELRLRYAWGRRGCSAIFNLIKLQKILDIQCPLHGSVTQWNVC